MLKRLDKSTSAGTHIKEQKNEENIFCLHFYDVAFFDVM
jgi:hypothetical protein